MDIFGRATKGGSHGKDRGEDIYCTVYCRSDDRKASLVFTISPVARKKCFPSSEYLQFGFDSGRIYFIPADKHAGLKISSSEKKANVSSVRMTIQPEMAKYQFEDFCGYFNLEFCEKYRLWYIDKNHKIF